MIDSVTIAVNEENYRIDNCKSLQLEKICQAKYWGNVAGVFDYDQKMKKQGVYAPRFSTGDHSRRKNKLLRITASLPKLVYGSNLYELTPDKLDMVCQKIKEHMHSAGLSGINLDLRHCLVERIDYSKNILLPDWLGTAGQFIHQLRDFNYKQRSDYSFTVRNGNRGDQINFHNSSQGFVIYDKISEIVESGFTEAEKRIVADVKAGKQNFNILRFEVSLRNKQALWKFIKSRFKNCESPTLENLFNPEISKAILLDICSQVFTPGIAYLLSYSKLKADHTEKLLLESGIKLKEITFWLYVVNKFLKIGVRQTFREIEMQHGKKQLEYLKQKIKKLPGLVITKVPDDTNIIKFLKEKLTKFDPILLPLR